jgi:hypothetical protein
MIKVHWNAPDGLFGEVECEDINKAYEIKSAYEKEGCSCYIEVS